MRAAGGPLLLLLLLVAVAAGQGDDTLLPLEVEELPRIAGPGSNSPTFPNLFFSKVWTDQMN